MQIEILGGGNEVGASCILCRFDGANILVDCGIRVSDRSDRSTPADSLPDLARLSELAHLDAVLVTHAHLDHTGALPLVHQAFPDTPIYATSATAQLMQVLLADALRIMAIKAEQEAEVPLYDPVTVGRMFTRVIPVQFGTGSIEVARRVFAELTPAGHILGAAMVSLSGPDGDVLVTGDFSRIDQRTVPGMMLPRLKPDVLITESTYGNRLHASRSAEENRLASAVAETLNRGGKVLIPVFALGRSQEVLLALQQFEAEGKLPRVPIWVDGLVRSICEVYSNFPEYLMPPLRRRIENSGNPFFYERGHIRAVTRPNQREQILKSGPCIIVASSGMLSGGPSQFYAFRMAADPSNSILLTGYQDEESPGRKVLEIAERGGGYLSFEGQSIEVVCHVDKYGLSAHADAAEIVACARALNPGEVMLVHGDPEARANLKEMMDGLDVGLPDNGDVYTFGPTTRRTRVKAPGTQEPMAQEPRVQEPRMQETRIHEPGMQDASMQDAGAQDARVQDARMQDARVQDVRPQDTWAQDARMQDARVQGPPHSREDEFARTESPAATDFLRAGSGPASGTDAVVLSKPEDLRRLWDRIAFRTRNSRVDSVAYSVAELAQLWYGSHISPSRTEKLKSLLEQANPFFMSDRKRPYLYRARPSASVVAGMRRIEMMKRLGNALVGKLIVLRPCSGRGARPAVCISVSEAGFDAIEVGESSTRHDAEDLFAIIGDWDSETPFDAGREKTRLHALSRRARSIMKLVSGAEVAALLIERGGRTTLSELVEAICDAGILSVGGRAVAFAGRSSTVSSSGGSIAASSASPSGTGSSPDGSGTGSSRDGSGTGSSPDGSGTGSSPDGSGTGSSPDGSGEAFSRDGNGGATLAGVSHEVSFIGAAGVSVPGTSIRNDAGDLAVPLGVAWMMAAHSQLFGSEIGENGVPRFYIEDREAALRLTSTGSDEDAVGDTARDATGDAAGDAGEDTQREEGPIEQNEALAVVDQLFPQITGLYRRGADAGSHTLLLYFEFPSVAREKYESTIQQLSQLTGWTVRLNTSPNQEALRRVALEALPEGTTVLKGPSIRLVEGIVEIKIAGPATLSPTGLAEACMQARRSFRERTGFDLVLATRDGMVLTSSARSIAPSVAPSTSSAAGAGDTSTAAASTAAVSTASASTAASSPDSHLASGTLSSAALDATCGASLALLIPDEVSPHPRMEINAAYKMIKETLSYLGVDWIKAGKKHDNVLRMDYIELAFISPLVGVRHVETIRRLADDTGWPMRISPNPNQRAIDDFIGRLVPLEWGPAPSASYFPGQDRWELKVESLPADEELINHVRAEFEAYCGYRLDFVERRR